MHQNRTLILTVLPQLQSTPFLQTPLLAGQIASLVTMLKEPVDSSFTNPRGLGLPFQSYPSHFGERLDRQAPIPHMEQTGYHPLCLPKLGTNLQGFMN